MRGILLTVYTFEIFMPKYEEQDTSFHWNILIPECVFSVESNAVNLKSVMVRVNVISPCLQVKIKWSSFKKTLEYIKCPGDHDFQNYWKIYFHGVI